MGSCTWKCHHATWGNVSVVLGPGLGEKDQKPQMKLFPKGRQLSNFGISSTPVFLSFWSFSVVLPGCQKLLAAWGMLPLVSISWMDGMLLRQRSWTLFAGQFALDWFSRFAYPHLAALGARLGEEIRMERVGRGPSDRSKIFVVCRI